MMNRYRYQLEDLGVFFESKRSNGQKFVVVKYRPPSDGDSSASSDSDSSALTDFVPSVPCVPAQDVGWSVYRQFRLCITTAETAAAKTSGYAHTPTP